jgi:peptide/nickel transport system permease protein
VARNKKPLGFKLSSGWLYLCLFVSIFGGLLPLPKWDEYDFDAFGVGIFSKGHIFGTDFEGQDVLSQLVHGTRMSLVISFVSVLAASVIGGVLGIIAAYRRGWVDSVITMYFNVTLSIPTLILVLAMVAVFASPDPFDPSAGMPRVLVLILSLTFVIIPVLGRLARSSALSWTGRDFVLVAESLGMKKRAILWNHIVPNVRGIPGVRCGHRGRRWFGHLGRRHQPWRKLGQHLGQKPWRHRDHSAYDSDTCGRNCPHGHGAELLRRLLPLKD